MFVATEKGSYFIWYDTILNIRQDFLKGCRFELPF